MPIRWEKLAGDTDKFAVKMAFASDPDDGRGIDPDAAISWGGIQLWVKSQNLCAHQEDGERLDSVHWYLLPLVEWLVQHWSFLHEEHPPAGGAEDTARASLQPAIELKKARLHPRDGARHGWWRRHALRAAREGGLFPDVVLRRAGSEIEISWGNSRIQGMPRHFSFDVVEPGFARFQQAEVTEPLYEVVSGAGRFLASRAAASDRIQQLNREIQALRPVHGRMAPTAPDSEPSGT